MTWNKIFMNEDIEVETQGQYNSSATDHCKLFNLYTIGWTMLHFAVAKESISMVQQCLYYNRLFDPQATNVQDKYGWTALHYVCAMASKAYSSNLSPDLKVKKMRTSLLLMSILIRGGANIRIQDVYGNSPVDIANDFHLNLYQM